MKVADFIAEFRATVGDVELPHFWSSELIVRYLNEAVQSRKAAGVGASGEDGAIALFLPDMTGPTQFEVLAHQLSRRGHPESTIDKLMGLNWQRLLTDAWSSEN